MYAALTQTMSKPNLSWNIIDIPALEQLYIMTMVDICNYIAAYYVFYIPQQKKIRGLCFSPNGFPPPRNIDSGGNNDTFHRLKT